MWRAWAAGVSQHRPVRTVGPGRPSRSPSQAAATVTAALARSAKTTRALGASASHDPRLLPKSRNRQRLFGLIARRAAHPWHVFAHRRRRWQPNLHSPASTRGQGSARRPRPRLRREPELPTPDTSLVVVKRPTSMRRRWRKGWVGSASLWVPLPFSRPVHSARPSALAAKRAAWCVASGCGNWPLELAFSPNATRPPGFGHALSAMSSISPCC
jgi:hypothetical protein